MVGREYNMEKPWIPMDLLMLRTWFALFEAGPKLSGFMLQSMPALPENVWIDADVCFIPCCDLRSDHNVPAQRLPGLCMRLCINASWGLKLGLGCVNLGMAPAWTIQVWGANVYASCSLPSAVDDYCQTKTPKISWNPASVMKLHITNSHAIGTIYWIWWNIPEE